MAKNLLDAGHQVLVHDVMPEAVVDLRELGAATAATPSEVASKTSKIVTMLPSRYVYSSSFFYLELNWQHRIPIWERGLNSSRRF